MNLFTVLFFTILCFASCSFHLSYAQTNDQGIKISNAWVRMMPPSERTTAAYLEIENNTPGQVILESASSDAVQIVELHQMSRTNGMMKMGMARDIVIDAGARFSFDETGYHLMLINLKEPLKKDAMIPIVLHFKGGPDIAIKAVVTEGKE